MFDKLIETEPQGADFHGRKRYFMVSSVVMGVLFITAVVYSLYAAEVGLGTENLYVTAMLGPVNEAPEPPEIERPRETTPTSVSASSVPIRKSAMASVDEPTIAPTSISTSKNSQLARPRFGDFKIGGIDHDPGTPGGSARSTGEPGSGIHGTLATAKPAEIEVPEVAPPPPVKRPETKPVTSLGVINGRAAYLPKPTYSAVAIAVKAQGKVDVQVLIDEEGKVISAKALSGHPLLKDAAVRAAQNARFTPTLLSKVPVKVTGVIVYNFTR